MELKSVDYMGQLLEFPTNTLTQHFIEPYLGFLATKEDEAFKMVPILIISWGAPNVLSSEWAEAGVPEEDFITIEERGYELGVIYQMAQDDEDDSHYVAGLTDTPTDIKHSHVAWVTTTLWDPMLLVSREEKLIDMFNAFFQNASIPLVMLNQKGYSELTGEEFDFADFSVGIITDKPDLDDEDKVLDGSYTLFYGDPGIGNGDYYLSWDIFPEAPTIGIGPIMEKLFKHSPLQWQPIKRRPRGQK